MLDGICDLQLLPALLKAIHCKSRINEDAELRKQRDAKRTHFLTLLAKTANVGLSARASGLRMSSVYHHRHANPEFERAWALALRQGKQALASGRAPAEVLPDGRACVVGRATDGSPILKEARANHWNPDKERRFFETLSETNNIRMATDAAGIRDGTIYTRRKQWPEFAKAMADARKRAEARLEKRMAETGSPTLVPPKIPFEIETRIETVAKALKLVQIIHPDLQGRSPIKHRKGALLANVASRGH